MKHAVRCFLFLALLVTTLTALPIQSTSAQGTAGVSLAAAQVGVAESGEIDATITCDPGGCVAFTASLRFDPLYLRVDSAEVGPFLGTQIFKGDNAVDNVVGSIQLSAASLSGAAAGTDNILFRIYVTGLVPGATQMTLDALQVQDSAGNDLPISQQGSDIVVVETGKIPPFSPPAYDWEVAFVSDRDGNPEIYAMSANGSDTRRLTDNPARDSSPDWSPDGSQIVFVSDRDGNPEIYVMSADGTNPVRLTNTPGSESEPAWSPDGKQIAFVSDRDGNSEIYVMNADGSNVVRLTDNPAVDDEPSWKPDGSTISFISTRDGATSEVYLMNKDGSNVSRLTNGFGANAWYPVWAPDGTHMAFTSERDGNADVYAMNPDGSNLVKLTDPSIPLTLSDWAPNSRFVALASNRDGDADLYVINTDINRLFRLNDDPSVEQEPDWKAGPAACSVRTDQEGIGVRLGPGYGRSIYTYLSPGVDLTVTGQYADNSGAIWWQLDKAQVDPGFTGESLWVAEADVNEQGSCALVAAATPSDFIPAQPTQVPGTWGGCGSCDTCGHPGECVTSPDHQCLWDPTTCAAPPPPPVNVTVPPGVTCYTVSLSVNPPGAGSISAYGRQPCGGNSFAAGSPVNISASQTNIDYQFLNIQTSCGSQSLQGQNFTFTITNNCQATANFLSIPG